MTPTLATRTAITPRSLSLLAGALALAAIAWNAGSVSANFAARPVTPPPAVIGVIDLEGALRGLKEREVREGEFKTKIKEQEDKVKKMGEEAKAAVDQLEAAKAADKPALRDKARDLSIRFEVEKQLATRMLNRMQADLVRDLYDKIDAAAEAIALRDGYAMVLSSDEGVKIPPGDMDDVSRGIALKRMLFVAKELDITQDLITLMNNDFAAGKPAVGAAPAATPAKPTAAVPTTKK